MSNKMMNHEEKKQHTSAVIDEVLKERQAKFDGGTEVIDDLIYSFKEASKGVFSRNKGMTMKKIIEVLEIYKKEWNKEHGK